MGALHQGHISLIEQSKVQSDLTICSIFVNPTQFNDKNDFNKYPIQIDSDLELLMSANCDVVFIPTVEEIYPKGTLDKINIDLGFIGKTLDAEHRPGHFEGVLQVVKRLLDIVQPSFLFLGKKDYQQCMVLTRLVEHFHLPVEVKICETLREPDGLAMSSRNARLSNDDRKIAVKLSQALFYIKENISKISIQQLIEEQINFIQENDLIRVEYLVIVNGKTLEPITEYDVKIPTTILIAAKVGDVRLIDNIVI
jgi:pantoate--beta-alanine ligase